MVLNMTNSIMTIDIYHKDGVRKGVDIEIPYDVPRHQLIDKYINPALDFLDKTKFQTTEDYEQRHERVKGILNR